MPATGRMGAVLGLTAKESGQRDAKVAEKILCQISTHSLGLERAGIGFLAMDDMAEDRRLPFAAKTSSRSSVPKRTILKCVGDGVRGVDVP